MALYCGVDLHSNNHVVVIIDDEDRRVEEQRLPNDLALTLSLLGPYRDAIKGVAVESTFNWYWPHRYPEPDSSATRNDSIASAKSLLLCSPIQMV